MINAMLSDHEPESKPCFVPIHQKISGMLKPFSAPHAQATAASATWQTSSEVLAPEPLQESFLSIQDAQV